MSDYKNIMGCQLIASEFLRRMRIVYGRVIRIDDDAFPLIEEDGVGLYAYAYGSGGPIFIDTSDRQFNAFIRYLADRGISGSQEFKGAFFYFEDVTGRYGG